MVFRPFFCLILSCFCVLLASQSVADIKIDTISGYSKQKNFIANSTNSSLQIMGGFAGAKGTEQNAGGCATLSTSSTCNNCVVDDTLISNYNACNPTRAHRSLNLTFTMLSTAVVANVQSTPKIETVGDANAVVAVTSTASPTVVTGPNQKVTLNVTWENICNTINEDVTAGGSAAECEFTNASQAFRIGFDGASDGLTVGTGDDSLSFTIIVHNPIAAEFETTTLDAGKAACLDGSTPGGICEFSLTPGDEKAFVKNVQFAPVDGNARPVAYAILLCQNTADFDQIEQTNMTRLLVANGILVDNKITGLTNGLETSCNAAIEDDTGNVGYFLKLQNLNCPAGTTDPCRSVTPDEVLGLFADKTNCFVATAAYGSKMEKHVVYLREFRDRFLMKSLAGRLMVRLYYTLSPPAARWIAQDSARREVARLVLSPVIFTTRFLMNWSWVLGLVLLFGCCLIAFRRKLS